MGLSWPFASSSPVARHRRIHLHAPGVDPTLQVRHQAEPLNLDQPAAELPAADACVAEHDHFPVTIQQGVDPLQPVHRPAQGQMHHRVGQGRQFQFGRFADVHQL
jgi:hypothetical protein